MKAGNRPEAAPAEGRQGATATLLFPTVVAGLYGLFFLVNPARTGEAFAFGLRVAAKLGPVLLLVFVLIFLTNLLLKPGWVRRRMGRDSGAKGFLVALVGGILSMGPVYVWYAMLRDFQEKGMRPALIAVFLYSRGIKLPMLPLMAFYFGMTYTVLLTLFMVLFALLNGLAVEGLLSGQRRHHSSSSS
jgi:uncharacterized membrane protein YraQ (UPF0718 family)